MKITVRLERFSERERCLSSIMPFVVSITTTTTKRTGHTTRTVTNTANIWLETRAQVNDLRRKIGLI